MLWSWSCCGPVTPGLAPCRTPETRTCSHSVHSIFQAVCTFSRKICKMFLHPPQPMLGLHIHVWDRCLHRKQDNSIISHSQTCCFFVGYTARGCWRTGLLLLLPADFGSDPGCPPPPKKKIVEPLHLGRGQDEQGFLARFSVGTIGAGSGRGKGGGGPRNVRGCNFNFVKI